MKAVIVSLWNKEVDISLDELEELIKTMGGETLDRIVQKKEKRHPGTYIGSGKIEEIKLLCEAKEADTVIFDDQISPVQRKNLTAMLEKAVLDRTDVILKIFSENAKTNEAKMQVELAELKYKMPEIVGLGKQMSRLGGGVGTKGPGEKEKEYKRRTISDRVKKLEKDIEKIRKGKSLHKQRREKENTKLVSIIGYTNAGKSTLLNALTKAGVLEENKLFSTLDTKIKKLYSKAGKNIVLSDTVGFIRKLPHILVASFKSTLEEVIDADLILEVVDLSKENFEKDIEVTKGILNDLGAKNKKRLFIFNKIDKVENYENMEESLKLKYGNIVFISAYKKINLEALVERIEELV